MRNIKNNVIENFKSHNQDDDIFYPNLRTYFKKIVLLIYKLKKN